MIENQKLANLLIKIEHTIDDFIKCSNSNEQIAKDVKELIKEKLTYIGYSR